MLAGVGGAVLNVTNDTFGGIGPSTFTTSSGVASGGFINNALYRRPMSADDSKAGSGIFRDLYTLKDTSTSPTDPQEGYNRNNALDAKVANGFDPFLTVSGLVEDATGWAYVFVIDTNEAGNNPEKFISLDDFKVFLGGPTDPNPMPTSSAGLASSFGPAIYSMSSTGDQNHVLLDYSLFSGSGQMDLFVFVPKALFAGALPDDQVYIYTRFGTYGAHPGFDPSAGSEQVSIPGKTVVSAVDPLVSLVPEPNMVILLLLAAGVSVRARRR